jgi:ABC-type polysaccharide/polyol phosphate transport system ATPase subunit
MTNAIEVHDLSKRYRKGRGLTNLRELLSVRRRGEVEQYHWAVRDVSFALQPGEALGIIGPNGAGKTTILKLLSQVTKPTSGTVSVNGRFSALIELGAGFHPDLTGRENIYLNGAILGMQRREVQQRFDEIVDFAGIGDYLDTPVKRYSSGMYARLGFAVAAHVDPDVLLVDEVLAVGDYAFQEKCHARMDQLRGSGTALVFVSHNFESVRRVCDRGLVMYQGGEVFQGSAADAVVAYSEALRAAARHSNGHVPVEGGLSNRTMTFAMEIVKVALHDVVGQPISSVNTGDRVMVVVDVRVNQAVAGPFFSLTVRTPDGGLVYDTTTQWQGIETPTFAPGEVRQVTFSLNLPLLAGQYDLGVDVGAANLSCYYDRLERALSFSVNNTNYAKGIADLGATVAIGYPDPDREEQISR